MDEKPLYKMPLEHQIRQKPPGTRTSDYYACEKLPRRFECPGLLEYILRKQPTYMTTSNMYGMYPPTVHEMPNKFYGQTSKFTELMGARISRDCGLNP
ncbi:hypothetical protein BCR33DRAFT_712600 [Rhizoclosmatium globosum]|uniref:Uncharacterized protein n=1 Tax=Rhizoclosmatium globosum TaxID=329046 RepID=A0A1Y2CX09_9FUNG|nr:hypothetical protein BCR33DRAFT_712600 [Rhizoclosmatium globosum]|eukprot:ORY51568.1 hypothetical protein BCR33DRAFT_712600 [Rhizoclosmatium globosum]